MRNAASYLSADDTTVATSVAATDDTSFVNVPMNVDNIEALDISVAPKHDIIGLLSSLQSTQICVTMKARDLPDEDEAHQRAPVDIVIALDCSGSMRGNKLELCKKTLLYLLRVLYPNDRFCLITYADDARVDIPIQKMTEDNKQQCAQTIQGLRTRGCTNISAAIGLACQELAQIEDPNGVQTVFLLTDGHANKGVSKPNDLVELTRNCFRNESLILQGTEGAEDVRNTAKRVNQWNPFQQNKKAKGSSVTSVDSTMPAAVNVNPITLHCFGYGSEHNSELLREMSSVVPGGSYYFVEHDNNVGGAFGDALGGVLSVVAQNAVVTIRVDEEAKKRGVEIVDVYHSEKLKRENGSYSVTVGDFYAEESRDVLMEVKLAQKSDGQEVTTDPIPHVTVSVSYTDTLKKTPMTSNLVTCSIARPNGSEVSDSNHHVDAQWLRLEATKAISEANEMARRRDIVGAQRTMMLAKVKLDGCTPRFAGTASKPMLDALVGDMDFMESSCLASASVYTARGSHGIHNYHQSYAQQRCQQSSAARPSVFQGKEKKKMAKAFDSNTDKKQPPK